MNTVTKVIPSYIYQEYNDDDDLQAFAGSYNALSQEYLDWFNSVELPVYTQLSGELLDWVALGLYGIQRPSLVYGQEQPDAVPNDFVPNDLTPNDASENYIQISGAIGSFVIGISAIEGVVVQGSGGNFVVNDDIFKRIITWYFYKDDGKTFNIRWLKRRCERFLNGVGGSNPIIDQTYEISVVFGPANLVIIIIRDGSTVIGNPAVPNEIVPDDFVPNNLDVTYTGNRGRILKAGIESGVLALPYEYRYQVYG